jgi:hypothetical protein
MDIELPLEVTWVKLTSKEEEEKGKKEKERRKRKEKKKTING